MNTLTIDKIKQVVEQETGYDLTDQRRIREQVYTRAVYFTLCRNNTLASFQAIGNSVNKNHATVLHGVRLYEDTLERFDKTYSELYKRLQNKILMKQDTREKEIKDIREQIDNALERLQRLESSVF